MTAREQDAIRTALNVMRTDISTVANLLTAMLDQGFTAEEAQEAINKIASQSDPQ